MWKGSWSSYKCQLTRVSWWLGVFLAWISTLQRMLRSSISVFFFVTPMPAPEMSSLDDRLLHCREVEMTKSRTRFVSLLTAMS